MFLSNPSTPNKIWHKIKKKIECEETRTENVERIKDTRRDSSLKERNSFLHTWWPLFPGFTASESEPRKN